MTESYCSIQLKMVVSLLIIMNCLVFYGHRENGKNYMKHEVYNNGLIWGIFVGNNDIIQMCTL